MHRSLLIFAFGFPVHHLPEAGEDLALPLPPLLLVEGGQRPLLVRTVDLVFLSQTHSLHTALSEEDTRISQWCNVKQVDCGHTPIIKEHLIFRKPTP